MMENPIDQYRIAELIFLELKGELNEEERKLLFDWVNQGPDNQAFYKKITDEESIIRKMNALRSVNKKDVWNKINFRTKEKGKFIKSDRYRILKYAAAALIPLLIGSYLYYKYDTLFKNKETVNVPVILAGTQKAILTTSANERIELGENGKTRIFHFIKATATDTSHTLIYRKKEAGQAGKTSQIALNTLETPRGGEYSLVLSDGSKVLLNAETRLTFPESFDGNSREVALEGEAYFEVSKSGSQSFIVKTDKLNIRVYGTSFNVSTYNNESMVQTTLVEGSIGVSVIDAKTEPELKVKPGQQFIYDKSTGSSEINEVDTGRFIAWTKGMFIFENEPVENILKVMSRWYNFDYEFKDENLKKLRFTLSIGKYDKVSKILNLISISSNMKFTIKENLITVYSE